MGQQRSIDIADVFQFELSPVPPALIDEYGCLRKGDKAMLLKSISVSVMTPSAPDVVQVDGGQLLYHVVWPVLGTTGDVAASFGIRLTHYRPVSKKLPAQRTTSGQEEEEPRKVRKTPPSMPRSYSPQFQEQESAQQHYMQLPPFHSSPSWTVLLPMMKQTSPSAATGRRRSDYPNPQ